MKYLKMLGLAAVSASALMAFVGASTASATTLEIAGTTKNESIAVVATLEKGMSALLETTTGTSLNTCTSSELGWTTTSPFTTTEIEGSVESLSFSTCQKPVAVHTAGNMTMSNISGTTNGTVYSHNMVVTVTTALGTLTCETGSATDIGVLTGVPKATEHATLHVNAPLNCTGAISSIRWTATYTITSPAGLGVSP